LPQQLERVRAAPKIPEWERIFQEMQLAAERVVQRAQTIDAATTQLDAWVDATLEKRRWLRARALAAAGRR
jgi:multiple sugar transport system substrate-binding protein